MGRFDTTKATINANIKKNGNQEITGSILNSVMTEMVDATDAQLTELSAEIKNVSDEIFGFHPISAEIKSTGTNVLCQLNLKANETYKIHLLLAEDVQPFVFPRLWDLDGNQLTNGTMSSGKEFDIEYTPTEDIVANLMLNIGSLTYLVNTICVVTIRAGVTLSEEVGMLSEELTLLSDNVTKVSEETTQIVNDFYGKESFVGAAMAIGMNVLAKLKLKASINYSINLTFEALAEGYVFPRLFSLNGVQLTSGTMTAGKDAFLIEYTPSEDMEVELRVNISTPNPNLVGTQCYVVVDTGMGIEERLAKVEGATGIPYVISKTIAI